MEDDVQRFLAMAERRRLATDSRHSAGTGATGRGEEENATTAIIDSQSVKTTEVGGEEGVRRGKKLSGRKRHLAVDTLGLILTVVVHAACVQGYDGAGSVFEQLKEKFKRLKVVFADSAYGRNALPD